MTKLNKLGVFAFTLLLTLHRLAAITVVVLMDLSDIVDSASVTTAICITFTFPIHALLVPLSFQYYMIRDRAQRDRLNLIATLTATGITTAAFLALIIADTHIIHSSIVLTITRFLAIIMSRSLTALRILSSCMLAIMAFRFGIKAINKLTNR